MDEGRSRQLWDHTSHVLARIHNAHCVEEANLMSAAQCNPFLADWAPRKVPIRTANLKFLWRFCTGQAAPNPFPDRFRGAHGKRQ